MTKNNGPARLVFLGTIADTEDLAVALVIGADCHQDRFRVMPSDDGGPKGLSS